MKKRISEKQAMYALEVLPPATWYRNNKMETFQTGEAYNHSPRGLPRFATYERNFTGNDKHWYYLGNKEKISLDKKWLLMESEAY